MITINNRIFQIKKHYFGDKQGSHKLFCEKVEVKSNTASNWMKDGYSIGNEVVRQILKAFPNIDSNWLLTGNGEMEKKEATNLPYHIKGSIPYYAGLPVSAGEHSLAEIVNEEKPTGYMSIPGVSAQRLFPVVGCSMLPIIKPGDIIGINEVNSWNLVDPNKIYMIITHEDRMIKRLRIDNDDSSILWCVSDNYKEFEILKENIKAIYHVVYHGELL